MVRLLEIRRLHGDERKSYFIPIGQQFRTCYMKEMRALEAIDPNPSKQASTLVTPKSQLHRSNFTNRRERALNRRQTLAVTLEPSIEAHTNASIDHITSIRTSIESPSKSPRIDLTVFERHVRFCVGFTLTQRVSGQGCLFQVSLLVDALALAAGGDDVADEARVAEDSVRVSHRVFASLVVDVWAHGV